MKDPMSHRKLYVFSKYWGLFWGAVYFFNAIQQSGSAQIVSIVFMVLNLAICFWGDARLKRFDSEKIVV